MHIMDYRIANDKFDQNTKAKSRIADDVRSDCQVCGKAVNRETCKTWVHLSIDGIILDPLISSEEYGPESQGFFPVGSECAKIIAIDYKITL